MSLKFSPFTFLQTANTAIMAASLSFLFGLSTLSEEGRRFACTTLLEKKI
jgi:hypothetical protein